MAYNSNKGNQQSGDIQFESDPTDTQIDFENDFVAIKTNGVQRLIVSSNTVTSSVALSCSHGITGSTLDVGNLLCLLTNPTMRSNTVLCGPSKYSFFK